MEILPPKHKLVKFLEHNDFFLWQYYGNEFLSKIQTWIFRSRIRVVIKFLRKAKLNPRMILDVGCGPMFISYALVNNEVSEYIGVDIMSADRLKKYRDAMNNMGVKKLQVIRVDAELLPFRSSIFDFALALDVLEHLSEPRKAAVEIYKVIKDDGMVAVSLPLENLFQRLCRVGFILMRIFGDPILKRAKRISITRTPDYHYVGNVKSYGEMLRMLRELFNPFHIRYTPIGFHKSINVNAVHILKKKS
jgi:SAM-dependent methyltransferase